MLLIISEQRYTRSLQSVSYIKCLCAESTGSFDVVPDCQIDLMQIVVWLGNFSGRYHATAIKD